jgi:hypothetical protein
MENCAALTPGGQELFRARSTPQAAPAQSPCLPAEKLLAPRAGRLPSRPITPACLPAPKHTTTQAPPPGTSAREGTHEPHQLHRDHHLRSPGCDTSTTLAEPTYVDGCGQICPGCDEAIFGPLPSWWDKIEPPF